MVSIRETCTFPERNVLRIEFRNDETLLNAYAEALKTRRRSKILLRCFDAHRLARGFKRATCRCAAIYLKIASYDDALLRLDMFEELVPSLDDFKSFNRMARYGNLCVEISRLFANEVASAHRLSERTSICSRESVCKFIDFFRKYLCFGRDDVLERRRRR